MENRIVADDCRSGDGIDCHSFGRLSFQGVKEIHETALSKVSDPDRQLTHAGRMHLAFTGSNSFTDCHAYGSADPSADNSRRREQSATSYRCAAGELAAVAEYNLGETTITQANFPEDSRFRNMPVRLNGVIAAPTGEGGPYPVVVILHGNHPGCPIPAGDDVDRWPCAPEDERPNYRGFAYLAQRLAEQGYVVLSININAENTFGFGEPFPGERLQ
jgi:hypothetical protein